jgi:hypothetical protein
MRHSFVFSSRFDVQHVELSNNLRIRVGQKREINVVSPGEVLQDCVAVVAYGGDSDAGFGKSLFGALQLNQLRFAKGSPIGRSKEQKNSSLRSAQRLA